MTENFSIPLKYKEGTYKFEEITDFNGKTLNIKCLFDNGIFGYIVPEHDGVVRTYNEEVRIYEVPENPVFIATYDRDGIIKHIELQRENKKDVVYIHFHGYEHSKETIYKYSCYCGDWISGKILEHKEKIARLFIDYSGDPSFLVNIYTPEDVQKTIERTSAKYGYPADDNSGEYFSYINDSIMPDCDTLGMMLSCTDPNFSGELFYFAINTMIEKIKENVLDKIDKSDNFKFIAKEFD